MFCRLPGEEPYARAARAAILRIKASIVEIERKLAGVMSDAGIMISNSASTAIIRLTMSSEVRPASLSWSSIDGDRVIEFFDSICLTSSTNRSLGKPVLRSGISSFPESWEAGRVARALIGNIVFISKVGCQILLNFRVSHRDPRVLPHTIWRG